MEIVNSHLLDVSNIKEMDAKLANLISTMLEENVSFTVAIKKV